MDRVFLYIDILGFKPLVESNSPKIGKIFDIINEINAHEHFAFEVIVFSDTVLVFNKNEDRPNDYYVTFLVEYVWLLFHRLLDIGIYFKGVLTFGDFNFKKLSNIDAYYGSALIKAHSDEKNLKGFGLFIDKSLSGEMKALLGKIDFDEKYDFVLLCQSFVNLYRDTNGVLPIDINILSETDTYFRIDEDLKFFREIEYLKNNYLCENADKQMSIRKKYEDVYNLYKNETPLFFQKFEEEGFLPTTLNPDYDGRFNPYQILAETEMNEFKQQ